MSPNLPWLTPNHALNCGDVIVAAASSAYNSDNFNSGQWGTVSCPAGNNEAWLECATFAYDGSNVSTQTAPMAGAVPPPPPSCTGTGNVPGCMTQVIRNFTPPTASAVGYGYQLPSVTPISDPLFPKWLCNLNLPAGLITMGCLP